VSGDASYAALVPLVAVKAADQLSAACSLIKHDRCGHIGAAGLRLWPGRGPRSWLELCPCSCHTACPIISFQPTEESAIYAACVCADHSDVAQRRRVHQQQRDTRQRLHKEALQAVLDKANKPTDKTQARAQLQSELDSRGASMPDWELDILADSIVGSRRTRGRSLSLLVLVFRVYKHIGQSIWRVRKNR
jgi:hypothetical protein